MKIKNAILILGPGKSGTTLLNDMLSMHADLYWISSYLNRYPDKPIFAVLNNLMRFTKLERYSRNKRKFPRPAESFQFWSHYIHNFHKNPSCFDNLEIENVQRAIRQISKWQKGNRLIIKLTGPTRISFIERVFEEPKIIWIDRTPEAIIASYLNSKWRYKDKPELFSLKSKTELLTEYADYYRWINLEKEELKKFDFKLTQYESLVNDPESFFKEVCNFAGLEFSSEFQKTIKSREINPFANEKYKKDFSKADILLIQKIIRA